MTSKKDEPGTDTAGPAGPGSSRPHATLDLKATVISPETSKDEKTSAAPAEAGAASALPGACPRGKAGAAKAEAPKKPAAVPAKAAGHGGFFTHLVAGIAGGIIALLAVDMLASELGLSGRGDNVDTSALQQRIADLEAASKHTSLSPQLAARLKAADAKLAKLPALSANVDRLNETQGALARDLKALDAKIATQGSDVSARKRIGKLEKQLATLSAAAERGDESGRLPQLAAVSGKIADLEAAVKNQLVAMRKSVNDEIDTRLMVANETSEASKSRAQRLDRELAAVKAETAQLGATLTTLRAQSDRTSATLMTTADALSKLKAETDARLATFAKPEDVSAAVRPLSGKLSALQDDVEGVVKSEKARKTTAGRIVLSLQLATLKRAIDRGRGFAPELAQVRKLSDGSIDLAPLAHFADTGVPTLAELRHDFKAVAFKMIDSEQQAAEGSIMERLLAGAKSVVRVRRISHSPDDKSVEAVVARMEAALNEDRPGEVLQEAKTLPEPAKDAARDFLAKVEARHAVDRALATVEAQLKASLAAPAGAPGTAQD